MTNNTMNFSDFWPIILTASPLFIVWIAGIILLVTRWKNHPRASLAGVIAFVLLILNGLFTRAVNIAGPMMLSRGSIQFREYSFLSGATSILSGLVNAAIFILVLVAIFGFRNSGDQDTGHTA